MLTAASHSLHPIASPRDMAAWVEACGILPFFRSSIPGLSVEELTLPGYLFADDDGTMGAWDWKGDVLREMNATYGKFFARKAGFVALDLLPDFLCVRRSLLAKRLDTPDIDILAMIRADESHTAAELRQAIFGSRSRKGQSVETNLTRLQMAGLVVIADFEYRYTRQGDRYGWGIARYTTPEALFGPDIATPLSDASQARIRLLDALASRLPAASTQALSRLLG